MTETRNCAACGSPFTCWGPKCKQRFCSHTCGYSANRSHGLTHTTENAIWRQMKQRCHNPRKSDYPQYGAKGIQVCERWFNSFENFYADMGPRPSLDHTVDRIDGTKGYSPDNCRWATRLEQNRNRKGNWTPDEDDALRNLTASGCTFPEVAKAIGKPASSVQARAYRLRIRSGKPCSNFRTSSPLSSPNLGSEQ